MKVRDPEKERADLKDQNESAAAEEFAEEAALDAYDITLERIKEVRSKAMKWEKN